jgi:hypothetical protein
MSYKALKAEKMAGVRQKDTFLMAGVWQDKDGHWTVSASMHLMADFPLAALKQNRMAGASQAGTRAK